MTISAFATCTVIGDEFCRYTNDQHVIPIRIAPVATDSPDGTEVVTVGLVCERTGTTVATKTYAGAARISATIDLKTECYDPRYIGRPAPLADQKIYAARHGRYHCVVSSSTGGTVTATATTPSFSLVVVTAQELKAKYLYGIRNASLETLGVVVQPQKITGVTISSLSPDFYRGQYTLSWRPATQTLQIKSENTEPGFDGAPTVVSGPGNYLLRVMRHPDSDYLTATVDDWALPDLNAGDIDEIVTIDSAKAADAVLRTAVADACRWFEGLVCPLEPTRITTDLDLDPAPHIATGLPTDYEMPTQMTWLTLSLPHRPLLAVDALRGKLNSGQVLDIPQDWRVVNKVNGRVSLVPNSATAVSWLLYGPLWFQILSMGFPIIPNFWHYAVVAGIDDLDDGPYAIVRELVAKKALIAILQAMGRAYQGGLASSSASKDSISTSSGFGGGGKNPFLSEIEQFEQFVDEYIKRVRQRIMGISHISFR